MFRNDSQTGSKGNPQLGSGTGSKSWVYRGILSGGCVHTHSKTHTHTQIFMYCFLNCILYVYVVKNKCYRSKSISRNISHLFLQYSSLPAILLLKHEQPLHASKSRGSTGSTSKEKLQDSIHIFGDFFWHIIPRNLVIDHHVRALRRASEGPFCRKQWVTFNRSCAPIDNFCRWPILVSSWWETILEQPQSGKIEP